MTSFESLPENPPVNIRFVRNVYCNYYLDRYQTILRNYSKTNFEKQVEV